MLNIFYAPIPMLLTATLLPTRPPIKIYFQKLLDNPIRRRTLASIMATAKKKRRSPREIALADKRWMRPLRRHTPSCWFKKVSALKDPAVRVHVACIIWWDFIAPATKPSRATKMDQFLNTWRMAGTPDTAALYAALVSLGYPEKAAKARLDLSAGIEHPTTRHFRNDMKRRTD